MTEPMDVDTLESIGQWLSNGTSVRDSSEAVAKDGRFLIALSARLRREREAIEQLRNEIATIPAPSADDLFAWLAALDAILRGEGTT